jgi:fumarate hydratase subunit beta
MDPFSPKLIAAGLKAMLGKGYRNQAVRNALKQHCAVHLSALGGAGALLAKHITAAEVIAYEDLGPEAIRRLEVVDFPAFVAYDCLGGTVYK